MLSSKHFLVDRELGNARVKVLKFSLGTLNMKSVGRKLDQFLRH